MLAPSREVGWAVVRRVVVSVNRGEHHSRRPYCAEYVGRADLDADEPAGPIAPGRRLIISPAPIAETEYRLPVRTLARLAPALGAAKADHGRELRPVDRVEKTVLAPDRHGKDRRPMATLLRRRQMENCHAGSGRSGS